MLTIKNLVMKLWQYLTTTVALMQTIFGPVLAQDQTLQPLT